MQPRRGSARRNDSRRKVLLSSQDNALGEGGLTVEAYNASYVSLKSQMYLLHVADPAAAAAAAE